MLFLAAPVPQIEGFRPQVLPSLRSQMDRCSPGVGLQLVVTVMKSKRGSWTFGALHQVNRLPGM